jgi:hypothetical protein
MISTAGIVTGSDVSVSLALLPRLSVMVALSV